MRYVRESGRCTATTVEYGRTVRCLCRAGHFMEGQHHGVFTNPVGGVTRPVYWRNDGEREALSELSALASEEVAA